MKAKANSRHIKVKSFRVPQAKIADFCSRHHVVRLALFGSVLRSDFRKNSDVDVLIEFDREHTPGFLGLARMERELSSMLGDRKVDLRTPEDLSRYFRETVVKTAQVHSERI